MRFKTGSKLALAAALLLPAAVAEGQAATDAELAQSLFDRGRALMTDGRYAEACPVLAESQRLDPGGGTLMNLALCHAKQGKTATAWSELNVALSGAVKDGRRDREALARQQIAALEPTLSHLTVVVPGDIPELGVALDGVALGRAAWGVPAAVDPGPHHVIATVRGRVTSEQSVDVRGGGDSQVVTVPAPLPAAAPVPPAPPPPAVITCVPGRAWNGTACVKVGGGEKSPWRWVALGSAVVAVGFTTGAGVAALEDHATMTSDCILSRNFCPTQAGLDAASGATTWAWVSTVSLGVAAASAAAFLFWPDRKVTVVPSPMTSGASVLVQGEF